ncbi:MAG: DUF2268 domain-containing protein [Lysinibacillus sp.]
MSVKKTQKTLRKISEKCQGKPRRAIASIQRDTITGPLAAIFPDTPEEAIYYQLLQNGLFEANEWTGLEETVAKLEERDIWALAGKEYTRLRKLWKGPEVDIYIYPLTKKRLSVDGMVANKNGVAYKNALFLFVTPELEERELYALLAHEYHHICRIFHRGSSPMEHSLKESLVIEGMAEAAVEELYGEEWLSPWAKRYTAEQAKDMWERHFVPSLEVKGVPNHRPFLYGDRRMGLPQWGGYSIGYHIVQSYLQKNGPVSQRKLIKLSADEIVAGSDFSIRK